MRASVRSAAREVAAVIRDRLGPVAVLELQHVARHEPGLGDDASACVVPTVAGRDPMVKTESPARRHVEHDQGVPLVTTTTRRPSGDQTISRQRPMLSLPVWARCAPHGCHPRRNQTPYSVGSGNQPRHTASTRPSGDSARTFTRLIAPSGHRAATAATPMTAMRTAWPALRHPGRGRRSVITVLFPGQLSDAACVLNAGMVAQTERCPNGRGRPGRQPLGPRVVLIHSTQDRPGRRPDLMCGGPHTRREVPAAQADGGPPGDAAQTAQCAVCPALHAPKMRKQGVNDPACRCNRRPALRAEGRSRPACPCRLSRKRPRSAWPPACPASGSKRAAACRHVKASLVARGPDGFPAPMRHAWCRFHTSGRTMDRCVR